MGSREKGRVKILLIFIKEEIEIKRACSDPRLMAEIDLKQPRCDFQLSVAYLFLGSNRFPYHPLRLAQALHV